MAAVLHLLKGDNSALVVTAIAQQLAAGDRVTVALLSGAPAPPLPAVVPVHRVPEERSYQQLLEMIFESQHVITW